ncbi:MAG TPA: hypothetical protein VKL22_01645 [Actinomycetota bacterium]|nr:hypothetical protein [Actinomycetota bacterium]
MKGLAGAAAAGLVALALTIPLSAAPARAQAPSPSPSPADTSSACQQGQLCVDQSPNPDVGGGGQRLQGHDPPAHFGRSLATMAVVALALGGYLAMAMTGRRLPLAGRRSARRR